MKPLVLGLILLLISCFPRSTFSQARDTTTRPDGKVTLEEFREALSDDSRIIYIRTITDSLTECVISYSNSKFYLEDSSSIGRNIAKTITEHWTYANRGAMYGAIGGVLIGGIISAIILMRDNEEGSSSGGDTSNSQGFLGPAFLIGGSVSLALPGLIIGAIIGSKFERGYHFPVNALEE